MTGFTPEILNHLLKSNSPLGSPSRIEGLVAVHRQIPARAQLRFPYLVWRLHAFRALNGQRIHGSLLRLILSSHKLGEKVPTVQKSLRGGSCFLLRSSCKRPMKAVQRSRYDIRLSTSVTLLVPVPRCPRFFICTSNCVKYPRMHHVMVHS